VNAASTTPRSVREELDRFFILLRRSLGFWKRALLVFILTTAATLPFAMSAKRLYRSETVVLYQETLHQTELGTGNEGGDNARRVGARLKEVLLARASLEPIVKDMHLYLPAGPIDAHDLVDAVDEMRLHINFRAREGDTFEIAYDGNSPQEAQDVTNRLAQTIVDEAAKRRAEHAKTLKDFLILESERNKVELRTKEAELAKFYTLHPEYAPPPPGAPPGTRPGAARPGAGGEDATLAALEWKALRIERQLKAQPGAPPPPPPKPPPAAVQIPDSPELIAARKDFEDKSQHFTDKHPDVVAARARLRAAEAAQAEAQAAADAKAAAAARAAAEEPAPPPKDEADREALKKELDDLRRLIAARRAGTKPAATTAPSPTGTAEGTVALEVELRRLQHDVNEARDRQSQLDDRRFKASISASSVMNDRNIQVSVLDPAYLPTHPISKPRRLLVAGALLACFLLALITALVSARLDDRIHDRADLEIIDVLPVMGVIPPPKALPKKTG
jgi:uncharacterized protein involved in exopolysaccharide biosynthesis